MSKKVYPHDCQVALGECIRSHRWKAGWGIEDVIVLINESFKPDPPITFHQIQQLEKPPITRVEPPTSLFLWLYNLALLHKEKGFLQNPATGEPFTDYDLLRIARCELDWRTGLPTQNGFNAPKSKG